MAEKVGHVEKQLGVPRHAKLLIVMWCLMKHKKSKKLRNGVRIMVMGMRVV